MAIGGIMDGCSIAIVVRGYGRQIVVTIIKKGTSADTRHFEGGHFRGVVTGFFLFRLRHGGISYYYNTSPFLLVKKQSLSFHDALSMSNCAFCHIWCYIYCSTSQVVLVFSGTSLIG